MLSLCAVDAQQSFRRRSGSPRRCQFDRLALSLVPVFRFFIPLYKLLRVEFCDTNRHTSRGKKSDLRKKEPAGGGTIPSRFCELYQFDVTIL